ncbi:hypothetical protein D1BOALGB6SA_7335 [Olavius sp. associated proteobacterium Delta 1]|nr:hypothetical protein D1BOALGB6SA_7335 [Olavius sp. associated proteobacterium Delta 1]
MKSILRFTGRGLPEGKPDRALHRIIQTGRIRFNHKISILAICVKICLLLASELIFRLRVRELVKPKIA